MLIPAERIEQNLRSVRRRMGLAAERTGRDPASIRLVAVTKSVSAPEIQVLRDLGVTEFGENRLESARDKIMGLGEGPIWHMVGSVQSRKVRDIATLFDYVDSIDRIEIAEHFNERCEKHGKVLPALVEVNVSEESSKHGLSPAQLADAIDRMRGMEHIRIEGLMTMAPLASDPEAVRPVFARLRRLGAELGLKELSMGMTNDFEVAIEEGATQVRIGTALFK